MRIFRAFLALLLFIQPLLADVAQSNLWSERQMHRQLAALPAMPLARPALPSILSAPAPAVPRASANPVGEIPLQFGSVRRLYTPAAASRGVVIHVQDVHRHLEAQRNISNLVSFLMRSKRVGAVALEGGFGALDFNDVRAIEDRAAVRTATDYLLSEHRLTGAVHALLNAAAAPPAIGIDDADGYRANVRAYRAAEPRITDLKKQLDTAYAQWLERAPSAVSAELLELQRRIALNADGKLGLAEFALGIENEARVLRLESDTAQLRSFLEALQIERKLDFAAVERERAAFLTRLTARLTAGEFTQLSELGRLYQSGDVSHDAFYQRIKNLGEIHGIPLSAYPLMDRYVRYVLLALKIDGESLSSDIQTLEKRLTDRLARTPAEKKWCADLRRLRLEKKLVTFALTRDEWKEYKSVSSLEFETWNLEFLKDFYEKAETRDEKMAENLLAETRDFRLQTLNSKFILLVTGGFHAPGIDRRLVDAGYTVAVFVPKITKVDSDGGAAALSVFTQEKTPLEKLGQGEKLFLVQPVWTPGLRLTTRAYAALANAFATIGRDTTAAVRGRFERFSGKKIRSLERTGDELTAQLQDDPVELRYGKDGNGKVSIKESVPLFAGFVPLWGETGLSSMGVDSLMWIFGLLFVVWTAGQFLADRSKGRVRATQSDEVWLPLGQVAQRCDSLSSQPEKKKAEFREQYSDFLADPRAFAEATREFKGAARVDTAISHQNASSYAGAYEVLANAIDATVEGQGGDPIGRFGNGFRTVLSLLLRFPDPASRVIVTTHAAGGVVRVIQFRNAGSDKIEVTWRAEKTRSKKTGTRVEVRLAGNDQERSAYLAGLRPALARIFGNNRTLPIRFTENEVTSLLNPLGTKNTPTRLSTGEKDKKHAYSKTTVNVVVTATGFTIDDTGTGIADDVLMEKFFMPRSPNKPAQKGTDFDVFYRSTKPTAEPAKAALYVTRGGRAVVMYENVQGYNLPAFFELELPASAWGTESWSRFALVARKKDKEELDVADIARRIVDADLPAETKVQLLNGYALVLARLRETTSADLFEPLKNALRPWFQKLRETRVLVPNAKAGFFGFKQTEAHWLHVDARLLADFIPDHIPGVERIVDRPKGFYVAWKTESLYLADFADPQILSFKFGNAVYFSRRHFMPHTIPAPVELWFDEDTGYGDWNRAQQSTFMPVDLEKPKEEAFHVNGERTTFWNQIEPELRDRIEARLKKWKATADAWLARLDALLPAVKNQPTWWMEMAIKAVLRGTAKRGTSDGSPTVTLESVLDFGRYKKPRRVIPAGDKRYVIVRRDDFGGRVIDVTDGIAARADALDKFNVSDINALGGTLLLAAQETGAMYQLHAYAEGKVKKVAKGQMPEGVDMERVNKGILMMCSEATGQLFLWNDHGLERIEIPTDLKSSMIYTNGLMVFGNTPWVFFDEDGNISLLPFIDGALDKEREIKIKTDRSWSKSVWAGDQDTGYFIGNDDKEKPLFLRVDFPSGNTAEVSLPDIQSVSQLQLFNGELFMVATLETSQAPALLRGKVVKAGSGYVYRYEQIPTGSYTELGVFDVTDNHLFLHAADASKHWFRLKVNVHRPFEAEQPESELVTFTKIIDWKTTSRAFNISHGIFLHGRCYVVREGHLGQLVEDTFQALDIPNNHSINESSLVLMNDSLYMSQDQKSILMQLLRFDGTSLEKIGDVLNAGRDVVAIEGKLFLNSTNDRSVVYSDGRKIFSEHVSDTGYGMAGQPVLLNGKLHWYFEDDKLGFVLPWTPKGLDEDAPFFSFALPGETKYNEVKRTDMESATLMALEVADHTGVVLVRLSSPDKAEPIENDFSRINSLEFYDGLLYAVAQKKSEPGQWKLYRGEISENGSRLMYLAEDVRIEGYTDAQHLRRIGDDLTVAAADASGHWYQLKINVPAGEVRPQAKPIETAEKLVFTPVTKLGKSKKDFPNSSPIYTVDRRSFLMFHEQLCELKNGEAIPIVDSNNHHLQHVALFNGMLFAVQCDYDEDRTRFFRFSGGALHAIGPTVKRSDPPLAVTADGIFSLADDGTDEYVFIDGTGAVGVKRPPANLGYGPLWYIYQLDNRAYFAFIDGRDSFLVPWTKAGPQTKDTISIRMPQPLSAELIAGIVSADNALWLFHEEEGQHCLYRIGDAGPIKVENTDIENKIATNYFVFLNGELYFLGSKEGGPHKLFRGKVTEKSGRLFYDADEVDTGEYEQLGGLYLSNGQLFLTAANVNGDWYRLKVEKSASVLAAGQSTLMPEVLTKTPLQHRTNESERIVATTHGIYGVYGKKPFFLKGGRFGEIGVPFAIDDVGIGVHADTVYICARRVKDNRFVLLRLDGDKLVLVPSNFETPEMIRTPYLFSWNNQLHVSHDENLYVLEQGQLKKSGKMLGGQISAFTEKDKKAIGMFFDYHTMALHAWQPYGDVAINLHSQVTPMTILPFQERFFIVADDGDPSHLKVWDGKTFADVEMEGHPRCLSAEVFNGELFVVTDNGKLFRGSIIEHKGKYRYEAAPVSLANVTKVGRLLVHDQSLYFFGEATDGSYNWMRLTKEQLTAASPTRAGPASFVPGNLPFEASLDAVRSFIDQNQSFFAAEKFSEIRSRFFNRLFYLRDFTLSLDKETLTVLLLMPDSMMACLTSDLVLALRAFIPNRSLERLADFFQVARPAGERIKAAQEVIAFFGRWVQLYEMLENRKDGLKQFFSLMTASESDAEAPFTYLAQADPLRDDQTIDPSALLYLRFLRGEVGELLQTRAQDAPLGWDDKKVGKKGRLSKPAPLALVNLAFQQERRSEEELEANSELAPSQLQDAATVADFEATLDKYRKKGQEYPLKTQEDRLRSSISGQDKSDNIAIRELIQNARDAGRGKRIDVESFLRPELGEWVRRVTDLGKGMDMARILGPLLVLLESDPEKLAAIIATGRDQKIYAGKFGQGFYSMFVDFDKVRLKTRNGKYTYVLVIEKGENSLPVLTNFVQSTEDFEGTTVEWVKTYDPEKPPYLEALALGQDLVRYVGAVKDTPIYYNGRPINERPDGEENVPVAVPVPGRGVVNGTLRVTVNPHNVQKRVTQDDLFLKPLENWMFALVPKLIQVYLLGRGLTVDIPRELGITQDRTGLLYEDDPHLRRAIQEAMFVACMRLSVQLYFRRNRLPPNVSEDFMSDNQVNALTNPENEIPGKEPRVPHVDAPVREDAARLDSDDPTQWPAIDYVRYTGPEKSTIEQEAQAGRHTAELLAIIQTRMGNERVSLWEERRRFLIAQGAGKADDFFNRAEDMGSRGFASRMRGESFRLLHRALMSKTPTYEIPEKMVQRSPTLRRLRLYFKILFELMGHGDVEVEFSYHPQEEAHHYNLGTHRINIRLTKGFQLLKDFDAALDGANPRAMYGFFVNTLGYGTHEMAHHREKTGGKATHQAEKLEEDKEAEYPVWMLEEMIERSNIGGHGWHQKKIRGEILQKLNAANWEEVAARVKRAASTGQVDFKSVTDEIVAKHAELQAEPAPKKKRGPRLERWGIAPPLPIPAPPVANLGLEQAEKPRAEKPVDYPWPDVLESGVLEILKPFTPESMQRTNEYERWEAKLKAVLQLYLLSHNINSDEPVEELYNRVVADPSLLEPIINSEESDGLYAQLLNDHTFIVPLDNDLKAAESPGLDAPHPDIMLIEVYPDGSRPYIQLMPMDIKASPSVTKLRQIQTGETLAFGEKIGKLGYHQLLHIAINKDARFQQMTSSRSKAIQHYVDQTLGRVFTTFPNMDQDDTIVDIQYGRVITFYKPDSENPDQPELPEDTSDEDFFFLRQGVERLLQWYAYKGALRLYFQIEGRAFDENEQRARFLDPTKAREKIFQENAAALTRLALAEKIRRHHEDPRTRRKKEPTSVYPGEIADLLRPFAELTNGSVKPEPVAHPTNGARTVGSGA